MSSPQRMRMFGFFACARTAVGKTRIPASRVSRIRIGFSFIGFVCYLLLVAGGLVINCRWKNRGPVVLHADDGPAFGVGFIERLVESADIRLAVVSPFAFGVCVMNETHKTWAVSRSRPFEHLLVAIRIAKGEDGSAADERVDPFRFARPVIDEQKLRLA